MKSWDSENGMSGSAFRQKVCLAVGFAFAFIYGAQYLTVSQRIVGDGSESGKVEESNTFYYAPDLAAAQKTVSQNAIMPSSPLGDESYKSLLAKKEAQIQYLLAKYKRAETKVRHYVNLAWQHADKYPAIEPELLLAIMQKESSLRADVKNGYGAIGLMQVVPRFHKEKIKAGETLFDPDVNIRVGAQVLDEYLRWHKGELNAALKRYSGGARGYPRDVLSEREKLVSLGAM